MGKRTAAKTRHRAPCRLTCERPPAWTEAHHIVAWRDGGQTDLNNLCLLCTYHHREHHRRGWSVHIARDGHPEWTPPAHLDPERRPVRNRAHHTSEISFAGPSG